MKSTWKKYLLYGSAVIVGGGLIFVLIRLILVGYTAAWTGFGDYTPPNSDFVRGKTLWDWMELLIIPLVLALGAFFLQRSERAVDRKTADDRAKLERELATDRQQEAALQTYLDRMTELFLKEKLGESENEKVLTVARVRTLTVLRGLNAARNGIALRFLGDIGLVGKKESKFLENTNLEGSDLKSIDLSETNLQGVNLERANLEGANLEGANLVFANLEGANLYDANLYDANLEGAKLKGANVEAAKLYDANVEAASLEVARLKGAFLGRAKLQHAFLRSANLEGANLEGANLEAADLEAANLLRANLLRANLLRANLEGANLESAFLGGANLKGAKVSADQLATAASLKGATMPDGTKHN